MTTISLATAQQYASRMRKEAHCPELRSLCDFVMALPEPEPFKVDKPGRYRQRDGGAATVKYWEIPFGEEENKWVGTDAYGVCRYWNADGAHAYGETQLDLVSAYVDPPSSPGPLDTPPASAVEAVDNELDAVGVALAASLAHTWINIIAERRSEPGYDDQSAAHEANRLAGLQARHFMDTVLAAAKESR